MASYSKQEFRASLQTTGNTATDIQVVPVPESCVMVISCVYLAKTSASPNCAAYERRIRVVRDGNGAPVAGSALDLWTSESSQNGDVLFVVNEPGFTIRVQVQGVAATTIDWTAWVTVYTYVP